MKSCHTDPAQLESLEPRLMMSGDSLISEPLGNNEVDDSFGSYFDTAGQITLQDDGSAGVSAAMNRDYDMDVIQFTAAQTGMMVVEMKQVNSAVDPVLSAYSYDGEYHWLTSNDNYGQTSDAAVAFKVTAGQTYFIKAYSADRYATGEYSLAFSTVPDDHGNTPDSATAVTLDQSGSGTGSGNLDYTYDADFMAVTATTSGKMIVRMNATSGDADPELYVYGQDGTYYYLTSDNDTGTGTNARAEFDVRAGQTYYIKAFSHDPAATGSYEISIVTDVDDYGNFFSGAGSFSLDSNGQASVTGRMGYSYDMDVLSFTATHSGLMKIDMAGTSGTIDPRISTYHYTGSSYSYLSGNDDYNGSSDAHVAFQVEAGQTYYIKAFSSDREELGDYTLTLATEPEDFGKYFHDAGIVTLDAGGATTFTGEMGYVRDMDVIEFQATATGVLTADIAGTTAGIDPVVSAYSYDGSTYTFVGRNDNYDGTGDARVSFDVTAGQTYFLKVFTADRDVTGSYSVTMGTNPDEFGEYFHDAGLVTLDAAGSVSLTAEMDGAFDMDVIRFQAVANGVITADMLATSGGITPSMSVYRDTGSGIEWLAIGSSYSSGSGTVASFRVSEGETYYLKAYSGDRYAMGAYSLDLTTDIDKFGSFFSDAGTVTLDSNGAATVAGRMGFEYDMDVMSFVASHTGWMSVDMSAVSGTVDPVLSAYEQIGSDTVYLTSNDNYGGTSSAHVEFKVVEGRTYYLKAFSQDRSAVGDYTVSLSTEIDDFGNYWVDAGQLTLDSAGALTFNGRMGYPQDMDIVTFNAAISGKMTILMENINGGVDPKFSFYHEEGGKFDYIGGDDNSGSGSSATATIRVTAGETYYLKLYSADRALTGDYSVSVSTAEFLPGEEDPTPGHAVEGYIYEDNGGAVLRVTGTDGSDVIRVSQSGNVITVNGTDYTDALEIFRVEIYSFGGSDTIYNDWSVSVGTTIQSGEGNDRIFENSMGSAVIQDGLGDDLIVTIGGGEDVIFAEGGLDSIWYDSSDSLVGAGTAEHNYRTLHRVSSFYQPWTSDPGSSDYISLDISGQNFKDPAVAGYANGWANYSDHEVWVDGAQYDDVIQGCVGDCYFLATLSSLADANQMSLRQMITPLGDGTYAVRFFDSGNEVYLRIDGDLPTYNGSIAYAQLTPDGETWVALAEKAYAHFRYYQDSYSSIEGGWINDVLPEITPMSTGSLSTYNDDATVAGYIRDNLSKGYSVTAGSRSDASSPIVGSHGYVVKSIDSSNYVTVYNPWGYDGVSYDSNSSDGLLRISLSNFKSNFSYVIRGLI
ncbi:MAG: C2 family cysteine protease [Phycisphaerae bacterium]